MASRRLAMIPQESAGWELPDWQRQQADLITDPAELLALLELDVAELPGSLAAAQDFPLRVPRRYVDLIEKGNPQDPLLRQVLSVSAELDEIPGYEADPLEEGDHTPVPGLLHKYQGRALLVVTGACAVHCRYCFRRHFPYQSHLNGKRWQQALAWLASRPD
ncbi:MAG: EF-P beta-lysylation protein EpmB, partial [Alcanivorax nanhaiticus]